MTGFVKNKLAMVDLDGTLVFTLNANYLAYKGALNQFGLDFERDYYARCCDGRSYRDFLPTLTGGDAELTEAVHRRKIELYAECLKSAEVNWRLVDILRAIKPDYYLALVTTASRANVERILEHFALAPLFDAVSTQEDVRISKPDPACYNDMIERFGLPRESCMIFEDSASGIAAALASGCQTFAVRRGGLL